MHWCFTAIPATGSGPHPASKSPNFANGSQRIASRQRVQRHPPYKQRIAAALRFDGDKRGGRSGGTNGEHSFGALVCTRLVQPESLSEIDPPRHKINNLRKCFRRQIVDSSFRNSYLRQAPRTSRLAARLASWKDVPVCSCRVNSHAVPAGLRHDYLLEPAAA